LLSSSRNLFHLFSFTLYFSVVPVLNQSLASSHWPSAENGVWWNNLILWLDCTYWINNSIWWLEKVWSSPKKSSMYSPCTYGINSAPLLPYLHSWNARAVHITISSYRQLGKVFPSVCTRVETWRCLNCPVIVDWKSVN
jgi:hypothetical protein